MPSSPTWPSGLTGLDEHQVRRWASWYRWTTLAMLALDFRSVIGLPDEQIAHWTAAAGRLRRLFRFFAATQCHGRSLIYETLS